MKFGTRVSSSRAGTEKDQSQASAVSVASRMLTPAVRPVLFEVRYSGLTDPASCMATEENENTTAAWSG
jgi:hypothetical protein